MHREESVVAACSSQSSCVLCMMCDEDRGNTDDKEREEEMNEMNEMTRTLLLRLDTETSFTRADVASVAPMLHKTFCISRIFHASGCIHATHSQTLEA